MTVRTTFAEAIRSVLAAEMRRDPTMVVFGEDVELAYVFGVTKGLREEFGASRVRDTPMSEAAIVGVALGAALTGTRSVPEIQFADFVGLAMDQLVNHVAKMRYMTGGQARIPFTLRMPIGSYGYYGPQHCQSPHAWLCNTPGLVVVMPSNAADAKGLLRSALRSDDPVVFLESKQLYGLEGDDLGDDELIPLGQGLVRREGTDLTVVATGALVQVALNVAEAESKRGISVEVIDPRTLSPLDRGLIVSSFQKTGRLVVADEGNRTCGFGSEVVASVFEAAAEYAQASAVRVCVPDTPIPVAPSLERMVVPHEAEVEAAVRRVLSRDPVGA